MKITDYVQQSPATDVALENYINTISLESNYLANVIDLFRNFMPEISVRIRSVSAKLTSLFEQTTTTSALIAGRERAVVKASEHLDLLLFGENFILTPENFKGKFLDYAQVLAKITQTSHKTQLNVFSDYTAILSSFITNKEDKISVQDHTKLYDSVRKEREQASKEISVFFKDQTGKSRQKLKSVISRFAELPELLKATEVVGVTNAKYDLKALENSVNHCADLIDLIIKQVKENSIKSVSPEAAKNIAMGAYEMAKFVEYISLLYYQASVFVNCINKMCDVIENPNKQV